MKSSFGEKLIDNSFDQNKTITKCHVNDKESISEQGIWQILCKPGCMRGNTKTGTCFESNFAQNQPEINLSAR